MLLFVQTLQDDAKVTPAKALMAVCTINTIWTSKIPVAMGATMPGTINAFFEGVAPEYAIGIADYFKVALIPGILGLIYCVACVKLIPDLSMKKDEVKEVKETKVLSKKHEKVVFLVFAVIMAAFFLSNVISKEVQNVIPVAGVLVFMITGVIKLEDVQKTIASDMIFLIGGMSAVSTILGNTGVGELIGQTVLKILGGHLAAFAAMNLPGYDTDEYSEYSSEVQAAIDMFGPVDIGANMDMEIKKFSDPNFRWHKIEETHGGALIGGDPETIRERAEKALVTNFVNEKMVPMMILHGDNDPIVPAEVSSDILYRKIVEAGLEDRVSYYMDSLWRF